MTGKKILMITMVLLLMLSSSVFVYADSIQAYFTEPVPVYEVLPNNNIHVVISWVDYQTSYYLNVLDATYPAGTHFYVQNNTRQSMYRTDNQPLDGTISNYNLVTGVLYSVTNADGVRLNDTVGSLNAPNYFKWVNNTSGNGYYPSNENFYVTSQGDTYYDVTWAEPVINQNYVRSVLPEPVYDEYNRYIVVTGENVSLLFWLNLHIAGVDQLQQSTQNTYDHYDYRQTKYFAPTFLKSNNGYELRLEMDPILRVYLNSLGYTGIISCHWQLTEYNLVTGEFIQSVGNTIDDLTPDIYYQLIQSFTIDNAVGISLYGVNYTDSSDEHLHRAAVIYSVDPSFETWKSQVLTWLERIYGSMSQEAETVTIADDMSAYDEMQSAKSGLNVTDQNGEAVDPVQEVEVAFSEAGSGLAQIGEGTIEVNNIITQLFSINPLVIIPLVVAMALGLIMTILGKNKSD